MPNRSVDHQLTGDSLKLLSVFRSIDNPALRHTIISLAYALRPSSYGSSFWARHRPRQPPNRSTH